MLTSDIVAVAGVDLFDAPVPEGQLAHPVDAAPHSRGQAQVGVGRRRMEAVRRKVVITETHTAQIHQHELVY